MSHTSSKIFQTTLLVGAAALGLQACTGVNPSSMPTGYTYHQEVYKSADPIPSPRVTDEQREVMTAAQAEQFRLAVYELVDDLTLRAGLPPKPVYVAAPTPMTPFYSSIDNDLREALLNAGYVLSDTPEESYVFSYEAFILDAPAPQMDEDGNEIIIKDYENVRLALYVAKTLDVEGTKLTEQVADYRIEGAETLYMPVSSYRIMPYNDYVAWRPSNSDDHVDRTVRIYE